MVGILMASMVIRRSCYGLPARAVVELEGRGPATDRASSGRATGAGWVNRRAHAETKAPGIGRVLIWCRPEGQGRR